jgi:hypothetical protein
MLILSNISLQCDEIKPKCSNCNRLETDCSWPSLKNLTASTDVPTETFQAPLPGSPAQVNLPIDELRLLHHWTLRTSVVFDRKAIVWIGSSNPWQDGIVELSFRNPFLLHAILSLSAIHKATTLPHSERSSLLMQSAMHIDIALQEFRNRLSSLNPGSVPAMFAVAAILIVHHLAKAQTQDITSPVDELLGCFRLVRGVKVVAEPSWADILGTEVAPLLDTVTREPLVGTVPDLIRLDELCGDREPYKQAVEKLRALFLEVKSSQEDQPSLAFLFLWPAAIEDDFIELLSEKDDIAMVILSYYSVLLKLWGNAWWIKGWGNLIMNAVREHITPGKYTDYLEHAAHLCISEPEGTQ